MSFAIAPDVATLPDFAKDWQTFCQFIETLPTTGTLQHYVNGKQLACPMPLLKLKMALKNTAIGNHVYVTATDPNSQQDIGAFCQHAGHTLATATTTSSHDTISHLLITKNC